eukprot:5810667-Ditylum_brightwellii.AAC.1
MKIEDINKIIHELWTLTYKGQDIKKIALPTTNLDYENKRGLDVTLVQIIVNHAAQHNFQLVCITHDE